MHSFFFASEYFQHFFLLHFTLSLSVHGDVLGGGDSGGLGDGGLGEGGGGDGDGGEGEGGGGEGDGGDGKGEGGGGEGKGGGGDSGEEARRPRSLIFLFLTKANVVQPVLQAVIDEARCRPSSSHTSSRGNTVSRRAPTTRRAEPACLAGS